MFTARPPSFAHTTTAQLFTQLSGHGVQALLSRTDQSEASTLLLVNGRCFGDAGGEGGVRHEAGVAVTLVAAHVVDALSIGTNTWNLTFIHIDAAGGIQPLVAWRTFNHGGWPLKRN